MAADDYSAANLREFGGNEPALAFDLDAIGLDAHLPAGEVEMARWPVRPVEPVPYDLVLLQWTTRFDMTAATGVVI